VWDNKGDIIIGNGAIIGTKAVVIKDVEPYSIVGGVPAKPIKKRFNDKTIEKLQSICWWNWDKEKVRENINDIMCGNIDKL